MPASHLCSGIWRRTSVWLLSVVPKHISFCYDGLLLRRRLIPQCPARLPQHTEAIDWASLPGAVEQAPHV